MSPSASAQHPSFSRNKSSEGLSSPEHQRLITNEQPKVDQPEASTNLTARGMLGCLLVVFILSVGIGVTVYDRFMHFGAPTLFPVGVHKGFTSGCEERGTLNVIWSCFSTIFTCVYTSLHLDVPYDNGEPDSTWSRKLWRPMKLLLRKATWVAFNIVAPELVVYVAVIEFFSARMLRKELVRDHRGIDRKWTLVHQQMANMGGFKVPVEGGGYVILRSANDFYNWANMNPKTFLSIDYKQVEIDIQNCSKADGLLKAYTVIQASWLVVQAIERVGKGLPVTELEVTTCAYVACAIFTYLFWWNKPYGVQKHISLHVARTTRPYWRQITDPTPFNRTYQGTTGSLELPAFVLSGIIGAVVGAIHCTLWNAQFANTNGQLLWRVCCITQIVAPILTSVFLVIPSLRGRNDQWNKRILLSALIPCFFQFCARIIIFILIGYSFWSQPADVYRVADWSWSWFPHIS